MNDAMLHTLTLAQDFMQDLWFKGRAATEAGQDTDRLFMFILWTCIISFVIVLGLAYFFAWKYRRRVGVPTKRSPSHNTALELAWSIIPLLVMVVIFFWGFRGYMEKVVAPAGAEVVRITGQQWNWTSTYDNGRELGPEDFKVVGGKSSPIITVPAGRPVKFMMSSRDVIHSFYIPDMRVKLDVFPNRFTSFWIEPMQAGEEHVIFCAEYCGQDHSEMNATLRVVTAEEFAAHKNKEIVIDDPVEFGKYLYRAKGCVACHSVDGSANTGPTWQGLYGTPSREFNGAPPENLADDESFHNYIRESVYTPNARIAAGFTPQMNSYQGLINEKQLDGIIAYIKSLGSKPAGAAPAEGGSPAPSGESGGSGGAGGSGGGGAEQNQQQQGGGH